MQVEIKLDGLNYGLNNAFISYWLSDVGDIICQDQPILELTCDKEIFSLFSPVDGIIQEIFFCPGETVGLEDVLGIIETDIKLFNP